MPKALLWTLRAALLLLTPIFLLCAAVARTMMQLDAWTVKQMAAALAMPPGKPQLVRRGAAKSWTGTEHGSR